MRKVHCLSSTFHHCIVSEEGREKIDEKGDKRVYDEKGL